ncbi:MAG TPA: AAA family ATPase [Burkholderiales bacterium]|nr:AAA family ATPase [Burkholderiales bacterium]
MQPAAIVLHGPTSSGKSRLAKALQASAANPAFHISLDAFATMANRGDMRSDQERDFAYHIHCENLRSTLARVVDTDFEIILDLVLRDTAEFDACLQVLASRPTYVVRVWAPLSVLEAREHARGDRGIGMAREQFEHSAYKRTYAFEVDTSACTPAEGAAAIRRFMAAQGLTGQSSGPPQAAADFQRWAS